MSTSSPRLPSYQIGILAFAQERPINDFAARSARSRERAAVGQFARETLKVLACTGVRPHYRRGRLTVGRRPVPGQPT